MTFDTSLESLIQRWVERSSSSPRMTLRMPLRTYLQEAGALAALMERHLEPLEEEGREYPGLSRVFDEEILSWETPGEIRELVIVIGELQSRHRATDKSTSQAPLMAEARRLRGEWMAALKFLFEQTHHQEGAAELRELRAQFKDQRLLGMVLSYMSLLRCVERHMEGLRRVGCGDDMLARTRALEEQLQRQLKGANHLHLQFQERTVQKQLLSELDRRVEATRRAFRFVFREHEDILSKAQSGYARARRRKHTEKKRQSRNVEG